MSDEERIDPPDSTGLAFESPEWWRVQHDYLVKLFNRSERMQREAWAEAKTAWAERDSLRAALEEIVKLGPQSAMGRLELMYDIARQALTSSEKEKV